MNNSIGTYSGRLVTPLDMQPEMVCIEDIAHALSMKCRFTGHCNKFYSVAQHSVLVARHCLHPHKYAGLMHDSTEAYLPDVASPVKRALNGFTEIEDRLAYVIASVMGIQFPFHENIHFVDKVLLRSEYRDLMNLPLGYDDYWKQFPFIGYKITSWHPQMAKEMFLAAYEGLKS